jgi:hypothetical protein
VRIKQLVIDRFNAINRNKATTGSQGEKLDLATVLKTTSQ